MSDPYWPWWAVVTFPAVGAWCAWLATVARRPAHVECPNCCNEIRTAMVREHWKVCAS